MSAAPILRRALLLGGVFAVVLALVGGIIGLVIAGSSGLVSALLGAAMAGVFLGITAVSILLASRYDIAAFFAIVMGAWVLKFVLFVVLAVTLRDQPWVQPTVLFLTLIVGIVGTLVIDVTVVTKSRQPYVDVPLPGDQGRPGQG